MPYQFAGNSPIVAIDLDGQEEKIVNRGPSSLRPQQAVQTASMTLEDTGKAALLAKATELANTYARPTIANFLRRAVPTLLGVGGTLAATAALVALPANPGASTTQGTLAGHDQQEQETFEKLSRKSYQDLTSIEKGTLDDLRQRYAFDDNGNTIKVGTYLYYQHIYKINAPISSNPLDWSIVPTKGKYAGEDRHTHVKRHEVDDLGKPDHGVFYGNAVTLTNLAWAQAQYLGLTPDANGKLTVPMGATVGRAGGADNVAEYTEYSSIQIITVPGTNKIITSYPVK